jgi:ABC-type transporter Mla maintaining outer membrane lipid asymmetry ATPase subunit MlaF
MSGSVEAASDPEATSARPPPGVWMRGVTHTLPDGDHTRLLLDHLDLDVDAGEMVAVMGPSG